MIVKKNVHKFYLIGICASLAIAYSIHSAPNTVVGCVSNTDSHCPFISPTAIVFTPDGSTAYVSDNGSYPPTSGFVSIMDVATNTVIGCVTNTNGHCPFTQPTLLGMVMTPDGSKIYVTDQAGFVSIIDVAAKAVIGCVANNNLYCPFSNPIGIAITPDGTKAYIANSLGASVSIIDVATDTVIGCVTDTNCPFAEPVDIAITPDGTKAYVTNAAGASVSVINLNTNTVTRCVANSDAHCPFTTPFTVTITPDGTKAYVGDQGGFVSVIDVATDTVIGCITNPNAFCYFSSPTIITITADGTTGYVADQGSNSVIIFDVVTNTVTGCVTNDDSHCPFSLPVQIAIVPNSTKAYVTNSNVADPSISIFYIPLFPPTSVSGCKTCNVFLTQTDFINKITWTAPINGPKPTTYNIYRDAALTQLVATVPATSPLQYYDHNRQLNVVYSYYIVSVDAYGNMSAASSVTVTQAC